MNNKTCYACPKESISEHHVYFKSQYFKPDREQGWNTKRLCEYHHRIMHHASTDKELKEKAILDYAMKLDSFARYCLKKKKVGLLDLEYELRKAKYKLKKYEDSPDR